MAAYGTMDSAIAGLLFGFKNDVESAIAQEDIAFGAPVFGAVGDFNKVYGAHRDVATVTYTSDTEATSVLTTVINGVSVANTYGGGSHAATMTAHIAAINANVTLDALGIKATAVTARIFTVTAPAGVDLVVTSAITVAGAATAAILYSTALKFLGVSVFVEAGGHDYGAGTSGWKDGDSVNILRDGKIWVIAASTVADKEPAYVIMGGSGTVGQFTDVSTSNYDIGAYFRSNRAGALAVLEVRGMK